ncbi:APC family permease [Mycobacterium sp. 21AC1]|uniref:APC family permease n=1 Tax=[Mycobacterium] appelbergii TaxID=2939269 RepID=UPI0029391849|nr:APC family permease [Mycobacterium sp. 21AC1]MDV3125305.1 APC family permease [Mycobacterium sp. 21AC1]
MTTTTRAPSHSLKANSVGVLSAVFMCMAFMGPAISVAYNTPAAAGGAGFALPVSILFALIACLLVASNIAAFAKKLPSAGFAYTYNSHAFGPHAGFLSGWAMLTAYGMVGPMIIAAFGGFASTFLESVLHINLPWQLLSAVFTLFIWAVLAAGITESVRVAFVFLAIEVGVIVALTCTILAKGGANGLSLQNFNPAESLHGIGGLGTGMLWGILMFIGFEAAATLGEEAKGSRRTIPAALFTAVMVIGVFYVFAAYGSSTGFGIDGVSDFASDTDPWATLAQKFWGGTALLTLTIIASAAANGIAGSNSAVRILFSMGRESILPAAFGRTSRNGVPQIALAAYLAFALGFVLLIGVGYGPFGVWGFCGTLLGLSMVLIYIAVSIAVIPFYLRKHRDEFSVLRHGVIPVLSAVVMLLPIYGQLHPLPDYPNNLAVFFIPVWMFLGAAYLVYLHRRYPGRVAAMGRVFDAPAETAPAATDVPDRV